MNLEAIEAFARGAMSALLTETPRRTRRQRRPQAAAPATPRQLPLIEPISAPGAPADLPAPPFTQAQADAMEAVLRGDSPQGYYKPDEGVAPWMES